MARVIPPPRPAAVVVVVDIAGANQPLHVEAYAMETFGDIVEAVLGTAPPALTNVRGTSWTLRTPSDVVVDPTASVLLCALRYGYHFVLACEARASSPAAGHG